jgi:hypothetical protein
VPDDAANHDDRLAAAVGELYQAAPEDFTGRRGELAAAARDAGDRAAAKAITALRKPTRAAWVVNRLAHTDPGAPRRLAELASALSAAQQAGHGPRLRELSAARWALIDTLTAQALAAARLADPPPSLRLEVAQTITAALADPAVAAEFAAGTLTKAAQWSGFGLAPGPAGADEGAAEKRSAQTGAVPAQRRATDVPGTEEKPAARGKAGAASPAATGTSARRPETSARPQTPARRPETTAGQRAARARRQAEEAQAQAAAAEQAAAEQAARRREQYQEAERTVAAASAASAEAGAAEDRLEAEVRDLEERITRARDDLAAARMRARRTEAAERRARQALDRLPR